MRIMDSAVGSITDQQAGRSRNLNSIPSTGEIFLFLQACKLGSTLTSIQRALEVLYPGNKEFVAGANNLPTSNAEVYEGVGVSFYYPIRPQGVQNTTLHLSCLKE
jgi:hypothetical protein